MDNLIMVNGTFYLVSDDPSSLPPLEYIASSAQNRADPSRDHEWEVLNKADATAKLGTFGGRYATVLQHEMAGLIDFPLTSVEYSVLHGSP